jgi:hypothetical protein
LARCYPYAEPLLSASQCLLLALSGHFSAAGKCLPMTQSGQCEVASKLYVLGLLCFAGVLIVFGLMYLKSLGWI